MLRASLALTLLALATQPAWPQTLAPGKPAGVQQAMHITYHQGFIGMSIIAVALTFALPSSGTGTTATTATTS
jgi:hypothetical protein